MTRFDRLLRFSLPIEFGTLLLVLGLLLLAPEVMAARERARRTQCINNFSAGRPAHNHQFTIVQLDREMHVASISDCPHCSFSDPFPQDYSVTFEGPDGKPIRMREVPLSSIQAAGRQIHASRSPSAYKPSWDRFMSLDESATRCDPADFNYGSSGR